MTEIKPDNKKQKPTKDPFILYYIIWPLKGACVAFGEFIISVWERINGKWYCSHCKKLHGRRVHRWYHIPSPEEQEMEAAGAICLKDRYICSLGLDKVLWGSKPIDDMAYYDEDEDNSAYSRWVRFDNCCERWDDSHNKKCKQ